MLSESVLGTLVQRVFPHATQLGLEPGHVHFELVSSEFIRLAASQGGLPLRYGHWSFGKSQERLKTAFDYRWTQIYELVVNHVPAYAFIDASVSEAQALMIVGHVLAHADYFRHHRAFDQVPKDMITRSARHRHTIMAMRQKYGERQVENLLDGAHVLADFSGESLIRQALGKAPDDVLGYVIHHAQGLNDWERQVLALVWEESRYFWPQLVTKVANEGYATFCHREIMRRLDLNSEEAWETARLHAQIVQTQTPQLNPYQLGSLLFQQAYDAQGWEGVFEARRLYDDVGLVRAFLTPEVVDEAQLAVYRERDAKDEPTVLSAEETVQRLVRDLDRAGMPRLVVQGQDGPALVLRHLNDGRDLDFFELPFALELVARYVWKGPIVILTERQKVLHRVSHDGREWADQVV